MSGAGPAAPVLEVRLAGKAFGPRRVLGALSFALAAGECLAVTGPSGVGKSTLLRIVAGLDPVFEGHVRRPARLSMVFQEPVLLPWRDARANLMLTTGIDARAAEAALAQVGLGGRGDAFPGQLSLGQQRRLSLARALATGPELLILDEPFASLDPETAADMLELTAALVAARRPAVLFVTHSGAEAARLGDRVLRLDPGPAATSAPGSARQAGAR